MMNKWEYPTENVMTEYFSLRDQLEKSEIKYNEDLIEEKEFQKKLEEIKQRREAFRLLSVKFGDLKHIIEIKSINNESLSKIFILYFLPVGMLSL